MLTNLIYLLILILGFPAGILLSRLCKEEIKAWKKRMVIISVISLALALLASFAPLSAFPYKFPVIMSLFFIIITCLTIVWKS